MLSTFEELRVKYTDFPLKEVPQKAIKGQRIAIYN